MASSLDCYVLSQAQEEEIHQLLEHAINTKDLDKITSNITIYGIPHNLRKLNEEAYTPQLISIGPLHFHFPPPPPTSFISPAKIDYINHTTPMSSLDNNFCHPSAPTNFISPDGVGYMNQMIPLWSINDHFRHPQQLIQFQMEKARYFEYFWVRVKDNEALWSYNKFLEDKRTDLLGRYAVEFRRILSDAQFLDVLLLDSVFIMELFLRTHENKYSSGKYHQDDNLLKQTWLSKSIQRDLLLLENQIPFFVLDELYETVVPKSDKKNHSSFIELANEYFECFRPDDDKLQESSDKKEIPQPAHFTDLIRNFYLCGDRGFGKEDSPLRSATKLQQAGVSFVKENKHLLDLQFEKHRFLSWFPCFGCIPKFTMFEARFQIPQLRINHTTEHVLRNIIALEQCHYANKPYVCNYVSLLDSLIHTKEDINLLVEKDVIVHSLGSDVEVENLVHGLCKNVVTNETCYKDLIDKLNKHYKRMGWNRNMATLRLVYFRDLWRASSTIIGLVVFMFTVLNFYQAIRGFHVVKD